MEKITFNEFKIHVICWSVYIFLEVIVLGLMNNRFSPLSYYIMFYALNFCLFYFHSWVVMKRLLKKEKKIYVFLLLLIFEVLVYLAGGVLITYVLSGYADLTGKLSQAYFAGVLFRGTWFIAYATGYFFIKAYLQKQRQASEKALEIAALKTQLLISEKDYLRAQINPHLFFNTLSFIKYASKRDSSVAALAVQELSEIMDYALHTGKSEFVPLSQEIEQIEKIINLNQLRYEQKLNVEFKKQGEHFDISIIPILLLTIVENIFKHGDITDLSQKSLIELTANDQSLVFATTNPPGHFPEESGGKSGLKNVMERLGKTYPGKFAFTFGMLGGLYKTNLRINL